MSRLRSRELEVAVPSWPSAFTRTALVGPAIETPLIPAMKARVCLPLVPIRVVPDVPGNPRVGDVDVVGAGDELVAGADAEGHVAVPLRLLQRPGADGDVGTAGEVGEQGVVAKGEILVSGPVVEQRQAPGRDVHLAGRVAERRIVAQGHVVVARRVLLQGDRAEGDVCGPCGV